MKEAPRIAPSAALAAVVLAAVLLAAASASAQTAPLTTRPTDRIEERLTDRLTAPPEAAPENPGAATPYVGEIRSFALDFCPRGWIEADGRALPVAGSGALFALIGTRFGGDGVKDYRLPDLRTPARVVALVPAAPADARPSLPASPFSGTRPPSFGQSPSSFAAASGEGGPEAPSAPPAPVLTCIAAEGSWPERP